MRKYTLSAVVVMFLSLALAVLIPYAFDTETTSTTAVLGSQTTVQAENTSTLLNSINTARLNSGLLALNYDDAELQQVTKVRAAEMVAGQYYSHKTASGGSFDDLLGDYYACENLQLQPSNSVDEAVVAWLKSPPHRECLLSAKTSKAAVSVAKLNTASYGAEQTDNYIFVFIASE